MPPSAPTAAPRRPPASPASSSPRHRHARPRRRPSACSRTEAQPRLLTSSLLAPPRHPLRATTALRASRRSPPPPPGPRVAPPPPPRLPRPPRATSSTTSSRDRGAHVPWNASSPDTPAGTDNDAALPRDGRGGRRRFTAERARPAQAPVRRASVGLHRDALIAAPRRRVGALVEMYAGLGDMEMACSVDAMPERDAVSWNASCLVASLGHGGLCCATEAGGGCSEKGKPDSVVFVGDALASPQ
ncbi:hypothetical protein ZWY2020_042692 [Hordeum vulgare]|nr:hypothetical protein ZWY2020_042692 [Hordeum vulgare]